MKHALLSNHLYASALLLLHAACGNASSADPESRYDLQELLSRTRAVEEKLQILERQISEQGNQQSDGAKAVNGRLDELTEIADKWRQSAGPEATEAEAILRRLQESESEVSQTKEQLDALAKQHGNLQNQFDAALPSHAYRRPDETGTQFIWSNTGPMAISTTKFAPVNGDSLAMLRITNLTGVNLTGGTFEIEWGSPMPDLQSGDLKAWLASFHTKEYKIPQLDAGSQAYVSLKLDQVEPSQVGFVDFRAFTLDGLEPAPPRKDSIINTSLEIDPTAAGYGVVWTDHGLVTVAIADVAAFADGSQVTFKFGNLGSAQLNQGTIRISYGARKPEGVAGYASWITSLKDQEFAIAELEAGCTTLLPLRLPAFRPSELGYIKIEGVDFASTSMRSSSGNK